MHATLALVFLASLVASTPFTYTSGVERGPQLTRILPGNIEHVRSMEKTDKSLFWNPTMVASLPKERFVLINPSVNVLPKEEFTTESVEGKQRFLMNPVIRSKGESMLFNPEWYRPIRANPIQSGYLSVKPEHTEGLFHLSGAKSDAMQQGQQLEATIPASVIGKTGSARKVEFIPGKIEYVQADGMQQSQQLESGKYGTKVFGKKSGVAKVEAKPGHFEMIKADAMQQSQQLDNSMAFIPSRARTERGAKIVRAKPGHFEMVKADAKMTCECEEEEKKGEKKCGEEKGEKGEKKCGEEKGEEETGEKKGEEEEEGEYGMKLGKETVKADAQTGRKTYIKKGRKTYGRKGRKTYIKKGRKTYAKTGGRKP